MLSSANFPESFQAVVQGEGIQVELSSLSQLRRGSWESRLAQVARVHKKIYRRGESFTEKEL